MAPCTEGMVKRVRIIRDEHPSNPRKEWDNVGTMVCWHRRYNLGDDQPGHTAGEFLQDLARNHKQQDVLDEFTDDLPDEDIWAFLDGVSDLPPELLWRFLDKHYVILPLYLYDHSGITMSCSPFSCPWDSGQAGYIYVSMDRARKEWTGTDEEIRQSAENCLRCEVETYDHYLTGEVYGYVLEQADEDADPDDDSSWDEIESCWGFYGYDWKTNGIKDHLAPDEWDVVVEE